MPVRLTPDQERALDDVRSAHLARLQARAAAEIEARKVLKERMRAAEAVESRAVRAAIDLGVSRRKIGLEGLGTSDYHTVTKVLQVTEPEAQVMRAMQDDRVRTVSASERRNLQPAQGVEVPAEAVVLRIDWDEIESAAGGTADLHGYAYADGARWLLVSDDDDDEGLGVGPLLPELRRNERLQARLTAVANEHS